MLLTSAMWKIKLMTISNMFQNILCHFHDFRIPFNKNIVFKFQICGHFKTDLFANLPGYFHVKTASIAYGKHSALIFE